MILKLYTDDGERLVFAGYVPDGDVEIRRPPNAPSSLVIHSFPIKDAFAYLQTKEVK